MNMMIASVFHLASLRSSCYLYIHEVLKARLTVSESSITNNSCLIRFVSSWFQTGDLSRISLNCEPQH